MGNNEIIQKYFFGYFFNRKIKKFLLCTPILLIIRSEKIIKKDFILIVF